MKNQILSIIVIILILGCTTKAKEIENETNIDFKVLTFPGIEYSGITDDYISFYAVNDSNFAIYVEQIIYSASSFNNSKQIFSETFKVYENFKCQDVNSTNWLSNAQVFECTYIETSSNTSFKSTIFYKNNEFIHSMLSVRGLKISEYNDVFNEFNQKAIQW
jgi:hypothetical protein